jgi:hypothetical protein
MPARVQPERDAHALFEQRLDRHCGGLYGTVQDEGDVHAAFLDCPAHTPREPSDGARPHGAEIRVFKRVGENVASIADRSGLPDAS